MGQYRSTQTSVKPNIGFVTGKADSDSAAPSVRSIRLAGVKAHALHEQKQLTVVDVPGHERLRARFLSQYHASSSSVVLVIDASSGLSGRAIKEACDHLQLILALNASTQSRPSLAVFLSKCDLLPDLQSMNHQSIQDKAKSALQREMERRRLASSSTFGGRVEGLSQVVGQPRDEAEILAAHSAYTDAMWTWETRAADAHFMSASSSAEGDRIRKEFSDWQAASSVR